jgi:hypothetical protein
MINISIRAINADVIGPIFDDFVNTDSTESENVSDISLSPYYLDYVISESLFEPSKYQ